MFNKYGNAFLPDEVHQAQLEYFSIIEKYLDKMSLLEARAFLWYINLDGLLAGYLLRRQSKESKGGVGEIIIQERKETS